MIYSLRKKFILISALAVSGVFSLILAFIAITSIHQMNRTVDVLADVISQNGGIFPNFSEAEAPAAPKRFPGGPGLSPESQFSTRFFNVWVNEDGEITEINTDRISSVSRETAGEYAKKAAESRRERGWIENYRYKVNDTQTGKLVVFVNGEMNRSTTNRMLYSLFFVLLGSFVVILLLVIVISKRAVKPAAESYEKQRQFVTDANHELKTPLTLILSNVDIVESEIGKNEWLDDIRSEGERMGELIGQLVTLSRMDEDTTNLTLSEFDLSDMVTETVTEFEGLVAEREKSLWLADLPSVCYRGDRELLRRLLAILLDNAVKYCDPGGKIAVTLSSRGHYPVITVENDYDGVEALELGRLFDRFYRADKARTYTGSYGIGLSIAQSIAKHHRGEITAYKKDGEKIGFRVILK